MILFFIAPQEELQDNHWTENTSRRVWHRKTPSVAGRLHQIQLLSSVVCSRKSTAGVFEFGEGASQMGLWALQTPSREPRNIYRHAVVFFFVNVSCSSIRKLRKDELLEEKCSQGFLTLCKEKWSFLFSYRPFFSLPNSSWGRFCKSLSIL